MTNDEIKLAARHCIFSGNNKCTDDTGYCPLYMQVGCRAKLLDAIVAAVDRADTKGGDMGDERRNQESIASTAVRR